MLISLVIITHTRRDLLITNLERNKKYFPEVETVVVVDKAKEKSFYESLKSMYGCKVVFVDAKSFSESCNRGFEATTGDFVIFLNDDAFFGPKGLYWLLEGFYPTFERQEVGAVGPVISFAGGIQNHPIEGLSFNNFDDISVKFHEKNKGKRVKAAFLSGSCVAFRREAFKAVGGWDEEFPYGFEDNAITLKLYDKGYDAVVVGDVYVYHYCQATTKEQGRDVFAPWKLFREKFTRPNQKVAGIIRVKNGLPFIKDSLRRLREVTDGVIVLDDGSTDGTMEFLKEQKDVKVITCSEKNEAFQRTLLTDTARNEGYNWAFMVDADEVIEDMVTRKTVDDLTSKPSVFGYFMRCPTFWRGTTHIRMDGTWGYLGNVRLFRLIKSFYFYSEHAQGLHTGAGPTLPSDGIRTSWIRLKHYGYCSYERVKEKYEYYTKHDLDKKVELIGSQDYSHLIDESNLHLEPFIEENTISLAVNVKNDYVRLYNLLNNYGTMFHEIVVGVDDTSTDASEEVAKSFGAKVVRVHFKNFSQIRNEVIRKCTSRWILVLDTDEDLLHPYNIVAMRDIDADAFLFTVYNHLPGGRVTITENPRMFKNREDIYFTGLCHETVEETLVGKKVYPATTIINHYGFLKPNVREKLELYKKLNLQQAKENPNDPRPYFNLALHYVNDGDDTTAEALFLQALALKPSFVNAATNLASLYFRKAYKLLTSVEEYVPKDHIKGIQIQEMKRACKPFIEVMRF